MANTKSRYPMVVWCLIYRRYGLRNIDAPLLRWLHASAAAGRCRAECLNYKSLNVKLMYALLDMVRRLNVGPNSFKFSELRKLLVPALVMYPSDVVYETDLTSSPLLIAWLPILFSIEQAAWDDGHAAHTWRFGEHWRPTVGAEPAVHYLSGLSVSIIVLFQKTRTICPLKSLEGASVQLCGLSRRAK